MGKISTPHNGQNILQWARQVTREINSLQPTGSSNVNVTKTGEGTTISVKDSALGKPDSTPANIGGTAQSGYTTTHSLEKNEQGALSLFEFGKSEETEYEGSDIPNINILVRDTSVNTVDGSPTLRYVNASLLAGMPDSEMPDDVQASQVVSKSIDHNSEDALEIYHFEDMSQSDMITPASDTDPDDPACFIVRHHSTNSAGVTVPTVKYMKLKDVGGEIPDSEDDTVAGNSIDHNSEDALEIYHFEGMGETDKYNPATATDPSLLDSWILVRTNKQVGNASIPTVQYMNIKGYTTYVNNQGGGGSGSVEVDCDTETVGKSIDWNTQGEIEIHDFELKNKHIAKSNFISASLNKDFLIRVLDTTEPNPIPELMYIRWSDLIDVIADNVSTTGYTGTETKVTDIRYNTSTQCLDKRTSTYTYQNGLVTQVSDNGWSTVTQAVAEEL